MQCAGCDLWWHPTCAQMSKEKFQLILMWLEEGSQSPWRCPSCAGHEAKLLKMVTAVSAKVDTNVKTLEEHGGRLDRAEDKSKVQESRLDCHEREIRDLREQMAKLGDMAGPGLVREMDERAAKENCLVFHRVGEGREENARGRINSDKQAVQRILNRIGVEIGVEGDIKSVRRLGARDRDGSEGEERGPRPILVVLTHRYHAEVILDNCWKLSEDPVLKVVSIVKDLTVRQRAREKEIYKEVASKNLSRSRGEVEDNMAYKVAGPRGSKREIFAPLREGEHISPEGDVVWDRVGDTGSSGRGRARGGRRQGAAAATYPNSETVGRPEGGTGWGQSLGTGQGQTPSQSVPLQGSGVRGGSQMGWRRGGGPTFGRGGGTWQGRGDQFQERGERDWQRVGREGSTRSRDLGSPQEGREPPGKRLDSRTSPGQTRMRSSSSNTSPTRPRRDQMERGENMDRPTPRRDSTPLIDFNQDQPSRVEGEVVVDQWGEVVDDVVEVI